MICGTNGKVVKATDDDGKIANPLKFGAVQNFPQGIGIYQVFFS
jgi:hypothetical protein